MNDDKPSVSAWFWPAAIIVLGCTARLWGFYSAGPLWLDELFITVNLKELGFRRLLGPLLEGQNAPVGWLWLEKALWQAAPENDFVLRTPALLASLLSLPLTWAVARRVLGEQGGLVALGVVAASPFAVWQSFQVKPYGLDLCASLMVLFLALRRQETEKGRGGALALGLAGAVLVWLSLPVIFTLAGVGAVMFLGEPSRRRSNCVLGAVWLLSFSAHFLLFLRPRPQPEWLYDYWAAGLLAWPPERWDLLWLPRVLSLAMADPVGQVGLGPLAAILLLVGLVAAMRPGAAPATRLVAAPILFALLASALRLYPFAGRLVLFLLPSLVIVGIHGLISALQPWTDRPALGQRVAAILLIVPMFLTVSWLPRAGLPMAADSRALFAELKKLHRAQEPVVLGHLATYAWPRYGVNVEAEVIETPSAWLDRDRARALRATVEGLDPGPVWVALTRVRRRAAAAWTYGAFIDRQTAWPEISIFRRALSSGRRVEREVWVRGGVLWRLVPSPDATPLGEDSNRPRQHEPGRSNP